MKKKIAVLGMLVLLLSVLAVSGAMAIQVKNLIKAATVYADYDTKSEVVGHLEAGDQVGVERIGKTWTKIAWGGIGSAWIKTKCIKSSSDVSTTSYYVIEDGATVREHHASSSAKLGSVAYGTKVHVVKIEDGWAKITWKNDYGYIKSRLLSRSKPSEKTEPSEQMNDLDSVFKTFVPANYHAVVTPNQNSSYVNLRWGPSTSVRVAGVCYGGKVLRVIAQGKNWCQVMDEENGTVGYMMSRFLVEVPEEILQTGGDTGTVEIVYEDEVG